VLLRKEQTASGHKGLLLNPGAWLLAWAGACYGFLELCCSGGRTSGGMWDVWLVHPLESPAAAARLPLSGTVPTAACVL
jgi:hypothetical protein